MWATRCLYHKYLHSLGNPIWSDDFYHQLFTHKALAILFWFLKTPYSLPLQGLCIYSFFRVKFSAPSFFCMVDDFSSFKSSNAFFQRGWPWPEAGPSNTLLHYPILFPSAPLDYMEISCLFAYLLSVRVIYLICTVHCLAVKSTGSGDKSLSLNISSGPYSPCDFGQPYFTSFSNLQPCIINIV